jgi:hypothetical protein
MQEIVQLGRKEDNMPPPMTMIQIHLKRMNIRDMRITYSKPNTKLSMTVDLRELFDLIIKNIVDYNLDSEGYYP